MLNFAIKNILFELEFAFDRMKNMYEFFLENNGRGRRLVHTNKHRIVRSGAQKN